MFFRNSCLGIERLRVAACRGHVEAAAAYGSLLYNDEKFEEAHKFLKQAADQDDVGALRLLYFYYHEGNATPIDKEKSIEYIHRAIEQGCPEALAVWGQAHFEGILVKKDASKGNLILNQAKAMGSSIAAQHFASQKIKKNLENTFLKIREALSNNKIPIEFPNNSNKVARNALCHCGSGKKYKRCCGQ